MYVEIGAVPLMGSLMSQTSTIQFIFRENAFDQSIIVLDCEAIVQSSPLHTSQDELL